MRANYEMVIDNLMDLSHIEFVHTGTFGGGGAFFSGQHSVEHVNDKQMWSRWWMPNVDPPIPMRQAMAGMKINHWQDMLWHAPSNFLFELGFSPTDVKREDGGKILQAHLLTPETERSTHYFYSGPPASMANPEMAEFMRKAFEDEDRVIIEAAQANMTAEFWEEKPLVLRTDAAAVQTRRALARLIREESGKPAQ
jgi:vanillate O-demethylase monooxygenase subunit